MDKDKREKLELAAIEKFPHICKASPSSPFRLELFADNVLLSSLRKCEAFFVEKYINRKSFVEQSNWNLDFGIFYHDCMLFLYKSLKEGKIIPLQEFLKFAYSEWKKSNFDSLYNEDILFYKFGGYEAVEYLLVEFFDLFFNKQPEQLNVISVETAFGYDREIPISLADPELPFNAFLCGRPDIVVHNNHNIGVLDWKTTSRFDGTEHTKYKPYDAITGYMYAVNKITRQKMPHLFEMGFKVDTAWVVCVLKTALSDADRKKGKSRFKKFPIKYTESELEEYRKRQISSFKRLYDLLVLGDTPQWNTQNCNNDFYHLCEFKALHEQASENRTYVEHKYVIRPDFYLPDNTEKKRDFND